MATFTPTQGRYLAFIDAYTRLHNIPPAESEIAAAMCVSAPSVNQMVKMLERNGLIERQPGKARSLRVLVGQDEIPSWHGRSRSENHEVQSPRKKKTPSGSKPKDDASVVPVKLYVFLVFLVGGPTSKKFANSVISRKIEIRGDQTLEQLHQAIFTAYQRTDERSYQFQMGARPFDPAGPNFGNSVPGKRKPATLDASTTILDSLTLKEFKTFGYWFDFDANWYHQVQLEKIEMAIPTVKYPRVISRVGKSPPQFPDGNRENG